MDPRYLICKSNILRTDASGNASNACAALRRHTFKTGSDPGRPLLSENIENSYLMNNVYAILNSIEPMPGFPAFVVVLLVQSCPRGNGERVVFSFLT